MPNRYRKSRLRRFLVVLCLISFTSSLWLSLQISPTSLFKLGNHKSTWLLEIGEVVTAQSPNGGQLVQQGIERYQAGDLRGAIEHWQKALKIYQQSKNLANEVIVLENLARAYQQLGQPEQAISSWNQVIAYYRKVGNLQLLGRSLTEQAQAYNSLGKPKEAIALLCHPDKDGNCSSGSAVQIAHATSDIMGEVAALGSLGDARRLTGDYKLAIEKLEKSLEKSKKLNNPALRVSVLNSLGNAHISLAQLKYQRANSAAQRGDDQESEKLKNDAKQEDAQALVHLRESLEITRSQKDIQGEVRSLVRVIPLYYRSNATTEAANSLQQATYLLERLPDSRARVYATIDLVRLLQPVAGETTPSRTGCLTSNILPKAVALLNQAVTVAQRLEDFRAESFALGELGHIHECHQEYSQALEITNRAILAAQQNLKPQDSLYLWEWQTGRILKAQGKTKETISAYKRAINSLETIRNDILTANRDIQFDFRDTIEPIYRDLVALLLSSEQPVQTASNSLPSKDSKNNFPFILKTINSLKLAELQDYFGNDCILTVTPQENFNVTGDSTTAFINTIVLEDKTAVILSLPDGKNKLSWIALGRQDLIYQINEFRRGLERFRDSYDSTPAQQVYNWLISPFANHLEQAKIKTLVFIQDGILRSVPMAALHDGKQFLIEKYAIATTPSLILTNLKALNRKDFRVLALGLSQATTVDGKSFKPLTHVPTEIKGIIEQIPGKKLLNDEFTSTSLETELSKKNYPVIHLATHGKFGTDPEDTFIVTGKKQKLTFTKLDELIRRVARNREQLEILTLTACETAVGDERSALGLAGVAVQAGARSALASLWSIDDAATAKIAINFYTKLLKYPNLSKAEALQAAQVALIQGKDVEFTHPARWSPFILIGNWL